MFSTQCKVDNAGKVEKTLKLHAATKRKLEFAKTLAAALRNECPDLEMACGTVLAGVGIILDADDGPRDFTERIEEPTDIASEAEVDEATEAKLDKIAPRKNAG